LNSDIANVLSYMLDYATPILLAALGEVYAEKSGILNLGIEGMMAFGAITGFIAALHTGNPLLGFIVAGFGGLILSLVHAFFTVSLKSNQVVSGLAIAIAGLGLSTLLGSGYVGVKGVTFDVKLGSSLSNKGSMLSWFLGHDPIVYSAMLIAILSWLILERTEWGLVIKASGEDPVVVRTIGLNVVFTRYACVLIGGFMAGVAGAYLSLVTYGGWFDGMTAGRGWLALGVVILGSWDPLLVALASYFVGFTMTLPYTGILKANGNLLQTIPYLAVVLMLIIVSVEVLKKKAGAPSSLGKSI